MADVQYVQLRTHYQGGFVFLAYVVAVVGAWTTIELLLRRTGGRGSYNIGLLIGAGVAFGSTATWGMHFVGNQAVTIHLPPPFQGRGIPLSYNIGYTILSLVVACLSMILAFSFIGLRLDGRRQPESDSVDGDEPRNSGSEKEFVDPEAGVRSPEEEDSPTQEEMDAKDRRFSWHPRNGSLVPSKAAAIINLPRPRKEKEVIAEKGVDEAEEDEGEFGTRPAKVSIGGMAKILTAGIIAGGGIAAMHYVGQVSINSVPKVNNVAYIVFLSILIAMVAVTVGLFLLFVVLRPKLQHSWYKRLGVAMILGLATSLMHFVALLGTRYYIVEGQSLEIPTAGDTSKHLIIALVCVVTPLCCLSLLVFAFVAQQRVLRQIAARHRIVLAVALFDQQGLLLCQHEDGLLPSAKIYPSLEPKGKPGILEFLGLRNRLSLNASSTKLTRSDPAFIAFLRASWAWRKRSKSGSLATGSSGLPGDEHLEGMSSSVSGVAPFHAGPSKTSVGDLDDSDGDTSDLSGVSVEALRRAVMGFEMAGQEIATALCGTHNLQSTGVLYDGILKTGHFEVSSKTSGDSFTVTQGQLLVLTRRIRTNAERDALIDRGYVFAEPGAVARVTSNAFAVPNDRVFNFFRDVHRFSRFGVQKGQDRGRLYGGVLIVQALPGEGLQIVVDERQHHSLPMVELATLVRHSTDRQALPPSNLATQTLDGVVEAVQSLGGLSLHDLANSLEAQAPSASSTSLLGSAALQPLLLSILRPFLDRTLSPETMAFLLPRLIITPTLIPLSERTGPLFGADGVTQDSYLICLKAVIPSSIALPSSSPLNWIPFPLYKAQADCIAKAWGHSRKTNPLAPSRPDTATSAMEQESDAPHSPASLDVFPPTLALGKRNSIQSRASEGDEEEGAVEASRQQQEQEVDPARPAGLARYDPDYVVQLVKTTIQPSKTWNWDLPTKELRKSGGRV
ncbi:hypothetical protein BCR35DRAFT_352280 [Leucosporidium creatinivorum]|uniref:MHYT domain-containing protein n=1 Tax=Leucosporidium creatinivorum TaxID=106004 RepID=A0A1Y2FED1_9BASI|nr:hypothetical protein BCR35DRAFT_352280 [Leucosporidium creatinivorum]